MWIGEFSVKIKLESWMIFNLLVTNSDCLSFLDENSAEKWIQNWFDVFVEILDQKCVAFADAATKMKLKLHFNSFRTFKIEHCVPMKHFLMI